jgi:hypothetical protein
MYSFFHRNSVFPIVKFAAYLDEISYYHFFRTSLVMLATFLLFVLSVDHTGAMRQLKAGGRRYVEQADFDND